MTTELKKVGFYYELGLSLDTGASIHRDVGTKHDQDLTAIVTYLAGGLRLYHVMSIFRDPLDPAKPRLPASGQILTDGVWVWPEALIHFVSKYPLSLPRDFLEHMRRQNFQPRSPREFDLLSLTVDGNVVA